MIFVLTGKGKGKTTSSIGMGIRALGWDKKVCLIRFLKSKNQKSEINVIRKFDNLKVKSFGRDGFFVSEKYLKKHPELKNQDVRSFSKTDSKLAKKGLKFAKSVRPEYDMLILDEICPVLNYELVNLKEVTDLINNYKESEDKHIVLTGRNCPEKIIKKADLVTRCKEIKHYFKKGKKAIKGIEY